MKNQNRYREIEGRLDGSGEAGFALVVSRFNSFITERLLEGALDCLERHGVAAGNISVVRVPGAWEIPLAAKRLAEKGDYAGIVCLGAVIRGATAHFEYVSAEVSKGIATVAMESGLPVIFGVLTTDTIEQAVERAGTKAGNKGWEAAQTALEMADLMHRIA